MSGAPALNAKSSQKLPEAPPPLKPPPPPKDEPAEPDEPLDAIEWSEADDLAAQPPQMVPGIGEAVRH